MQLFGEYAVRCDGGEENGVLFPRPTSHASENGIDDINPTFKFPLFFLSFFAIITLCLMCANDARM